MPDPSDHTCPRCGYDLSGACNVPRGAAELEGVCSECGLRFLWADLESGRLSTPRFSYEHGPWLSVRRFFGTLWRATTGWMLWKQLRMEHDVRPMRLLQFVLFTLAAMHLLSVAMSLLAMRFAGLGWWRPTPTLYDIARSMQGYDGIGADVLRAVLFTTSHRYQVSVADLATVLILPYNVQFGVRVSTIEVRSLWLPWPGLIGCILAQIVMAVFLLSMRQTRRQFRVRPAHILRGMCMSLPFVLFAYVALQALTSAVVSLLGISPWYLGHEFALSRPFAAAFLVAQSLWWWGFCRAYLRAPHALGIALAGTILGALLCFIVAVALDARTLLYLLA